jgi:hypothetical protein
MNIIVYTLLAIQAGLTGFTFVEALKYYRTVQAFRKLQEVNRQRVEKAINKTQTAL